MTSPLVHMSLPLLLLLSGTAYGAIIPGKCPTPGVCIKIGASLTLMDPDHGRFLISKDNYWNLEFFATKWNDAQKSLNPSNPLYVELHLHDDEGSPASVKAIYDRFVDPNDADHVDYLLSPFGNNHGPAIAKLANDAGKVYISYTGYAAASFTKGYKKVFSGSGNPSGGFLRPPVELLRVRDVKNAVIFTDGRAYTKKQATTAKTLLAAANITVIGEEHLSQDAYEYEGRADEFHNNWKKLCDLKPEAMFAFTNVNDGALHDAAFKNSVSCPFKATLLWPLMNHLDFLTAYKVEAEKFAVMGSAMMAGNDKYQDALFGSTKKFYDDLYAFHQEDPKFLGSARSAGAAHILTLAAQKALGTGTEVPSQDAVAQALHDMYGTETWAGPYGFTKCTDEQFADGKTACNINELVIYMATQVQSNGKLETVYPLDAQTATFVFPSPIAAPPAPVPAPASDGDSDDSDTTLIIIIVVLGIVVLLLCVCLVVILRRPSVQAKLKDMRGGTIGKSES